MSISFNIPEIDNQESIMNLFHDLGAVYFYQPSRNFGKHVCFFPGVATTQTVPLDCYVGKVQGVQKTYLIPVSKEGEPEFQKLRDRIQIDQSRVVKRQCAFFRAYMQGDGYYSPLLRDEDSQETESLSEYEAPYFPRVALIPVPDEDHISIPCVTSTDSRTIDQWEDDGSHR